MQSKVQFSYNHSTNVKYNNAKVYQMVSTSYIIVCDKENKRIYNLSINIFVDNVNECNRLIVGKKVCE